ncbi:hypothetical protein MTR67_000349 [Solanum verrucosum]|uniref:Uncharacterized protein n=1 Tax=Solanum verrucosum TaxID=315347 RepID=A0AAF0PS45_SOLVR|nr:hypothetical protein MTR67_000349 [Solanum verrucosum]
MRLRRIVSGKRSLQKRWMLELEVRRELMMEREIAISCGGDRFTEPMLFKEKMGMGVSVVSRHESNISTLNQSPKAEILQLQPPGGSEILLVRVLLYCWPCMYYKSRWPECPLPRKKHKRKEAAFREQKDNKNCSIALSPKKQKFIQLVEHDLISGNQFEEGSSGTNENDPPSLLIDDSTNFHEKEYNS